MSEASDKVSWVGIPYGALSPGRSLVVRCTRSSVRAGAAGTMVRHYGYATPHPGHGGPTSHVPRDRGMGRLNRGHRGGRRPPWPDPPSGHPSRLPGRGCGRPDARGFGVRKTVALKGALSETEQLRLRRAAEYCPVGQFFTKGALAIEDQVTCSAEHAPEAAASAAQVLQPPLPPSQPVPRVPSTGAIWSIPRSTPTAACCNTRARSSST